LIANAFGDEVLGEDA
jgi:hypothetical protein